MHLLPDNFVIDYQTILLRNIVLMTQLSAMVEANVNDNRSCTFQEKKNVGVEIDLVFH